MSDTPIAARTGASFATALVLACAAGDSLAQQVRDPRLIQVPDVAVEPDDRQVQPSGRLTIPMTGQAQAYRFGNLDIVPARVRTGLIEIGSTKSVTLELEHTGSPGEDPASIGAVRIEGKNADEYSVDFAGGISLDPSASQPITVTFTPRTPGPKAASLMLDVDGATAPLAVFLDGQARHPLVSELQVPVTGLGFGQVLEGDTAEAVLVLTNTGTVDAPNVFVSALQLGGDNPDDFAFQFQPQALIPGQSLDVPMTFSSAFAGTRNAILKILHDGNNPTLEVELQGTAVTPATVPVSFGTGVLATDVNLDGPTALQFGPDGKLYVGEISGLIRVFDVVRNGPNDYQANQLETIDLIQKVPNHNDDGTPIGTGKRQMTGMHVGGSAASPVIHAASSDWRHGGGKGGPDLGLDTNSGILHRLTKTGGGWQMQDLVRGLPRSEENHTPNGLVVQGDTAWLLTGGNTNQGVPSEYFSELSEYALSAALLEIDLGVIGAATYDLPTLDDEDRPGVDDANDPFGGNDGKNQAKLVAGGPVQVHTAGLRNAYDLVLTEKGRLYTFDNGSNSPYGGSSDIACDNAYTQGGANYQDNLHLLTKGSYAGHPNPVRGNKANTFNASDPQSPIEIEADPRECLFLEPGKDGALTTIGASTNGLVEYTASNFSGAMKGELLALTINGELHRLALNENGDGITSKSVLADDFAEKSDNALALESQGDAGLFPGTIWITTYLGDKQILILEPDDY